VRREKKPVQYWGSWIDCNTAEAALSRFRSAPDVPAELIITANTHGGEKRADPLLPEIEAPMPTLAEQERLTVGFANRALGGTVPDRRIRYYVLGAGEMRETTAWPPPESQRYRLYLDEFRSLDGRPPAPGLDSYEVDASASTGASNRWCWIDRPSYPDRRDEDRRLLTYDSGPFDEDRLLVPGITIG